MAMLHGLVRLDSSRVTNGVQGEILVEKGQLELVNSFVGGGTNDEPRVRVQHGGYAEIVYSTIVGGFVAPAIICEGASGASVRNSIVAAYVDTPEIVCPGIELWFNAIELDLPGNVSLGDMENTSWWANDSAADFHLTPLAPELIDTAAHWQEGDPLVDIDGEPRNAVVDAPGVAGADVR
ncbi:MAG: hypothetical protein HC927_00550 [Deltaproteobacteria bacterium]|nr:hypothetical protein [Deltaproteobacteria bacterium]